MHTLLIPGGSESTLLDATRRQDVIDTLRVLAEGSERHCLGLGSWRSSPGMVVSRSLLRPCSLQDDYAVFCLHNDKRDAP